MTDKAEPLEDLAAAVLNGVMIFLLGASIPAVVVWQVASHWGAVDVKPDTLGEVGQVITMTLMSLALMRCGAGLARTNILALLRRRRSTLAG